MQLRNVTDLSFFNGFRKTIFKAIFYVFKFALVTFLFYALFLVFSIIKAFGQSSKIPDTVLALIFTVTEILAIISSTASLTSSLYTSKDNKVLLTLPVDTSLVFFSKIILFFIYEVIKNFNFTLPLFLSYGLFNGAVWFYYLWIIIGFIIISLIPVALGAVLSVFWLYISNFISKYKGIKASLIIATGLIITQILFSIVSLIPENINILAQWNNLTQNVIAPFLNKFVAIFKPFYYLTLMIVGGTLAISSSPITKTTLIYFFGFVLFIAVCFLICFLLVKPLFFKMTAKQFEYEKSETTKKKNVVHSKFFSPFFEEFLQNVKSAKYLAFVLVQIILPAMLIFLLNKLYSAMQTSFNGQFMTKAFNMLVLLLSTLSFNNEYATVLSRQGAIRNFNKTRPISPITLTVSKITARIVISVLSAFLGAYLYYFASKVTVVEFICVFLTCSFLSVAHLFWCTELDVMNPKTEEFLTTTKSVDNANEKNATLYSLLISVIFAFLLYFLAKTSAITVFYKLLALAIGFFILRSYLFFIRVKLFYKEK